MFAILGTHLWPRSVYSVPMRILYKVAELTVCIKHAIVSNFSPKEENIQGKKKVQNKLYMNTIKIWGVAYNGQQSGDCLPTIGRYK